MRRAQAILVVVALLAAPLALLARGMACESSSCTMMCCLPQGSHSHQGQPMACNCPMKSGKRLPDFGLLAPIAPTAPAAHVTLAAPEITRGFFSVFAQSASSGFLSAPFEPPRT
jgi:hypothetical protein